ncbi:MAG: hypothetical protein CMJ21_02570 [Phycisphaerae bacterium]|nr:hypothetical protein [Phycisphaerae bacterium]
MNHQSNISRRIVVLGVVGAFASTAFALDDAHWAIANQTLGRGIAYLQTTQNEDGSWSPQAGPAVTAMILRVMLLQPDISTSDAVVQKALKYVMSKRNSDGAIHDGILANYNTSISLSALSLVNDDPEVAKTIRDGQAFLRGLQWAGQTDAQDATVNERHAFFGGAGYGRHGRPDLSNTQIMLEALYDTGVDCNDPIFQRALVFITRLQGVKENKTFGDKIINDGGFIYATSVNKDLVGVPQSMANPEMVEAAKQGKPVSGLRTYGSMTYAGFKSYVYANLSRDDPRVIAARQWIERNYTLDHNPGLPEAIKLHGLYYYYMTFARALDAWGSTHITTPDSVKHDWANDLIDTLAQRQSDDGSWSNAIDRWMESDANLVTGYALIALQHALH